jgi:GntR family transcriptional regulator of gluconate operon
VKSLRRLSSPTLAERSAELIRERILGGDFASGERLVEAKIAEQLGISRGPLREALKQLAAEGLVREEPRRGTFVATPTADDVRDVYDLRAAIEGRAARLVIANGDLASLENLRRAVDAIRAAAEAGDLQKLVRADYEFHETLCRVSGNRRLHGVFVQNASALRILLRLEEERFYGSFDEVWNQHRDLLGAVQAGDAPRAEAMFTEHLESARDRLLRHMIPETDAAGDPATGTR